MQILLNPFRLAVEYKLLIPPLISVHTLHDLVSVLLDSMLFVLYVNQRSLVRVAWLGQLYEMIKDMVSLLTTDDVGHVEFLLCLCQVVPMAGRDALSRAVVSQMVIMTRRGRAFVAVLRLLNDI